MSVFLAVVAGLVAVAALGLVQAGPEKSQATGPSTWATTDVARRSLSISTELEGTLGFGTPTPMDLRASGTVTWLPRQGRVLRRGDILARVDDRPVVLLIGGIPQYRALGLSAPATSSGDSAAQPADGSAPSASPSGAPGSQGSDQGGAVNAAGPVAPLVGRDVRQLERNLAAIGYRGFTVDDTFSELTARAVRRWQRDLGITPTGRVELGDVVFVKGPIRVAQVTGRVGAVAGDNVLSYTGTRKVVMVAAPADGIGWARIGTQVKVTLPGGRRAKGKVQHIGTEASNPESSEGGSGGSQGGSRPEQATLPVRVSLPAQKGLGKLTGGTVTVSYVSERRDDLLCVPVASLVALAEGGYGLEVVEGATTHFIEVKTGMFAEGMVEVSGPAVHEGLTVRMPQ